MSKLIAKKDETLCRTTPLEDVIKHMATNLLDSSAARAEAHNSFAIENTETGEETMLYMRLTISRVSLDPAVNPDLADSEVEPTSKH